MTSMYIPRKNLSLAFKLLIIVIGTIGILLQLGVFEGLFKVKLFNFFTIQCNCFCVIYLTANLVHLMKDPKGSSVAFYPLIRGMLLLGITVTMLVAHFLLGLGFSMGSSLGISMILLHYAVPILFILDCLLFERKGWIRKTDPLKWILLPSLYFFYAIIAAQFGNGIGINSRYPYPFMNADTLGWGQVLLNVSVLTIGFVLLGYLFYMVDRFIFRFTQNKKVTLA